MKKETCGKLQCIFAWDERGLKTAKYNYLLSRLMKDIKEFNASIFELRISSTA